jgi:hypothetical protein
VNSFYKYLTLEDKHHIEVVGFIKDKLHEIVCFHPINEGKRSAFEKYKFSIMGALAGIPDFVFLHPKYENGELKYHGLAIELKAPEHNKVVLKGVNEGKIVKTKGSLSKGQKEILEKLNTIGYKAVCCFGADEAIKEIKDYFKEYLDNKEKNKRDKFRIELKNGTI